MWNGYNKSSGWRNWIGSRVFAILQPLSFDQSLSYYEQVAHFAHKLNELIKAVNSQNVTIQDFITAVSVEIDDFEKRVNERQEQFEIELLRQFDEYKTQLNQIIEEFKTEMRDEWELYKTEINAWRNELINQWNLYKTDLTAQWGQFKNDWSATWETYKQTINNRLVAHESLIQDQLDEFRQDQTDFENNLLIMLTNWMTDSTDTLRAELSQWENLAYTSLKTYVDQQIGGHVASLTTDISMLRNELGDERSTRSLFDAGLQSQIDQLTPEGMIKVDEPDTDGNSQMYKVDDGERVDVYPTINSDCVQADLPDENGNSQLYKINKNTQERENIYPIDNTGTGTNGIARLHKDGITYTANSYTMYSTEISGYIASSSECPNNFTWTSIYGGYIENNGVGHEQSQNQAVDIIIKPSANSSTDKKLQDFDIYPVRKFVDIGGNEITVDGVKYRSFDVLLAFDSVDDMNSFKTKNMRIKIIGVV